MIKNFNVQIFENLKLVRSRIKYNTDLLHDAISYYTMKKK